MFLLLQICFFVMREISTNCQADANYAFNSMSRYLDDLLNIDHPYFMNKC